MRNQLRGGMVGMGMIFDDTYRPMFEELHANGLFDRCFGYVDVSLEAVATRTGRRAEKYKAEAGDRIGDFKSYDGEDAARNLAGANVDFVCVATPDNRHFEPAKWALESGKHVLIEKPSVLSLTELDELCRIAEQKQVLAKIVYHKLADPDHKKLRTLVYDGTLQHVNNGYCSLLEPKLISGSQFSEWIKGRNPGTYVAVHYIKLIDFTFGPEWQLKRISATGQRGIVDSADGPTWDSAQLRFEYTHPGGRDAAFDIHTNWVTPNNFPGYVEQEVQFRFDNGVWNAHQRKRGVELTVEDKTPHEIKNSLNNHYNGTFIEPWGEGSQRGYGIEILRRFVEEVAHVEFGGPSNQRGERLQAMRSLSYNDVNADRNVVAIVQALEAILDAHVKGTPGCIVEVNSKDGGLVLRKPGSREFEVLYVKEV